MADRFDLDAIDADDALLDLLAAGGESARTAGEHDPAVALLAELRLAVEVVDELPVETIDDPESFLARCAALNPITDPFARKVAARGLALGVAAVAALSVSGVAAAVNGDPLSPYEKVIEKMVDAVRPETSFPKEQLDGLPVVDKTKIVKVAKDFQKKAAEKAAAEDKVVQAQEPIPPAAVLPKDQPDVLQRVIPKIPERPTVSTLEPPATETTNAPEKTDDTTSDNSTQPSAPTTTEPAAPTTTEPSAPPTTTEPPATEPPAPPTTTEPPPTDPTTPPTNQPESGDPGTGNTGETGDGNPTTPPAGDTSQGDSTGSDTGATQPSDNGSQTGSADQSGANQSGSNQTPAGGLQDAPVETPKDPVAELVEKVIAPILLTPTGAAAGDTTAEQFFGESALTAGKHSSGETTTGSVRQVYPTGKHSSGQYAEGRHA
ncbi:MAG TPA: hypothetical protein VFI00_11935, partial [Kribbella sp.]|nr:hypothetical protein [Kribbella sp.]